MKIVVKSACKKWPLLQNSIRSTLDRRVHGQVSLRGRLFQGGGRRETTESRFIGQSLEARLGSAENYA